MLLHSKDTILVLIFLQHNLVDVPDAFEIHRHECLLYIEVSAPNSTL